MADSSKSTVVEGAPNALIREFYVQTFMGGEFELKDIRTLGDLRRGISSWYSELGRWGEESTVLVECEMMRGKLVVTMKDGIVQ